MPKVRIKWAKVKTGKMDKVPGAKNLTIREKETIGPARSAFFCPSLRAARRALLDNLTGFISVKVDSPGRFLGRFFEESPFGPFLGN
jgi:hypothetical protein